MKKQLQILTLMLKYVVLATFILAAAAAFYYLSVTWNTPRANYSILIKLTPTVAIQKDIPR